MLPFPSLNPFVYQNTMFVVKKAEFQLLTRKLNIKDLEYSFIMESFPYHLNFDCPSTENLYTFLTRKYAN